MGIDGLRKYDEVVVIGGIGGRPVPHRIDRITATQLVVNGVHYWKKNGREVGGTGWVRPITESVRDQVDLYRISQELSIIMWRSVSLDKLRRIKGILDENV